MVAIFWVFLILGLTSFGGPVAHIGYFHRAFVQRREWLSNEQFQEYLALCHCLPGPTSSQLGMLIGQHRAGWRGMLLAWLGFTLPSALLMTLLGLELFSHDWTLLNALSWLGVVLVAQAVIKLTQSSFKQHPQPITYGIWFVLGVLAMVFIPKAITLPLLIVFAGALGAIGLPRQRHVGHISERREYGHPIALWLLGLLLVTSPWLLTWQPSTLSSLWDSFLRAGTWVFGGGHVLMPVLQAELVDTQHMATQTFLQGYGAAQVMPGPLFSVAAFMGAQIGSGVTGALLALIAIFLPSFLLLWGVLPYWQKLRQQPRLAGALLNINAVVAGTLLAACWHAIGQLPALNVTQSLMALGLGVGLLGYGDYRLRIVAAVIGLLAAAISALGA